MAAGVGVLGVDRRRERSDRADEELAIDLGRFLKPLDIALDHVRHAIEVFRQLRDLEAQPLGRNSPIEVSGGDFVGGLGEALDRQAETARGHQRQDQRQKHSQGRERKNPEHQLPHLLKRHMGRLVGDHSPTGLAYRDHLRQGRLLGAVDLELELAGHVERQGGEPLDQLGAEQRLLDALLSTGRPQQLASGIDQKELLQIEAGPRFRGLERQRYQGL